MFASLLGNCAQHPIKKGKNSPFRGKPELFLFVGHDDKRAEETESGLAPLSHLPDRPGGGFPVNLGATRATRTARAKLFLAPCPVNIDESHSFHSRFPDAELSWNPRPSKIAAIRRAELDQLAYSGNTQASDHCPDQPLSVRDGECQSPRDNDGGQLTTRRVEQLHPHPAYVRYGLAVPASRLSALADLGDLAFREPLVITRKGTILDGRARWELARLQGRVTLPCLQYQLAEAESLHWLLQRHRRSNGLNDFTRILLALELEPWFREKALAHQRSGGQYKGASKLTEAERLDVRSEIAQAAGVSVGNVNKVRQLMVSAHPDVVGALRSGEVRIHRAWLWHKESPQGQRAALWKYRSERGIRRTVRTLISRHQPKSPTTPPGVAELVRHLPELDSGRLGSISVVVIRGPGKTIYLTEELSQSIEAQKELALTCMTGNR